MTTGVEILGNDTGGQAEALHSSCGKKAVGPAAALRGREGCGQSLPRAPRPAGSYRWLPVARRLAQTQRKNSVSREAGRRPERVPLGAAGPTVTRRLGWLLTDPGSPEAHP